MIPKKIHYCWFGNNELPKKARECIASWKKMCPDYEIIEWNENNFDVYQNPYTAYTYENKKYAFLSDYARLFIIYNEGGFYFDVDVEIVRSIDDLIKHKVFFGFETDEYINTGVGFGAEIHQPIIRDMLDEYDSVISGKNGTIGCPILNTAALVKNGFKTNGVMQEIEGIVVYPSEYFNPYDDPTGKLRRTENTYSIHWFAKSWMSKREILISNLVKPLHRIFGTDCFKWLKRK